MLKSSLCVLIALLLIPSALAEDYPDWRVSFTAPTVPEAGTAIGSILGAGDHPLPRGLGPRRAQRNPSPA